MLKIKSLGIIDKIYNWIEDWVKGRVQSVILLGSSSKWVTSDKGD